MSAGSYVYDELLGAIHAGNETHFRVWAPQAQRVEVVFEDSREKPLLLSPAPQGYFTGAVARQGSLYKYCVDGNGPWPDPCSRYQPQGVHGPSRVGDPQSFGWTDERWQGVRIAGQVVYELHVGTFTPEGTFAAATARLDYLRELGVTLVEIMPVSECPGRWNWGYDGVQLYAPYHVYGEPDDLKRFVDRAHALGIGVILDVVYNHVGPDGNYLKGFSPHYFSRRHRTQWGEPLNFDDRHGNGARDFIIGNATYWVREFHIDGFRLDATQSIFDSSETHVLAELVLEARAAALPRTIVLIAENEPQRSEHLLPAERGGFDLDAMWNDDFHHSARVALTGNRDGYFLDYTGRAQELISCVRHGFLYQGQWYRWQKKPRGSPLQGCAAPACVVFLQNHDQVSNTFTGTRIHAICAPARYRAMLALMLLAPQTPLLFMGQEFASSAPFKFFADHRDELADAVCKGRREFLGQFRAYADPAVQALVTDPHSEQAFADSKLDWSEAALNTQALDLHRDLLRLRSSDAVISRQDADAIDGATLSEYALVLRWFDAQHGDRLLVVNLDRELVPDSLAEPLLAPPRDGAWQLMWSSESPRYGGHGTIDVAADQGRGDWRLQAQSAALLRAIPTPQSPGSEA